MWLSGIWEIANIRAFAPKLKFGVFRFPIPKGGRYVTTHGGWAFGANALGRDPETAARFCAFALGSARRDCVQRLVDWCTVAKTDMAPRRSVMEAAEKQGGYDHWALRKFKDEIFPGARAEPRYPPVSALAELAADRILRRAPLERLTPLYLRRPDATVPAGRKPVLQ